MAASRGGLPLILLLSLAGSKLALGSTAVGVTMPASTEPPVSLFTTAATTPPSSRDTEAPTSAMPSTTPGTSSAVPTSAHTAAPPEPSTTVVDTTTTSITSMVVPSSTSSPSPSLGSTTGTSPDVSTLTTGSPPDTSTALQSPSATPGASQLFLSMHLITPLDMGNTTAQELLLAKIRRDLQTAFPCAGLLLQWRGEKLI
ncbi:cell wall protein DAN4-like isoform X2 [Phasianus colchicus]|uniref:cell wall protein DAN4-like isoform X2 n=1 Tax=Phasianus colchicus TaxID=9054 RepID=UPI00129D8B5D|nr:cell wall protein DAN4-like isoform X2 [Phasianus colchicus]